MGVGDTCYSNFVPFTMDEFERHLYIYYSNVLSPFPRTHMKFKSSSVDTVKVKDFLQKCFYHNDMGQYK